jgi:hypothetical protein
MLDYKNRIKFFQERRGNYSEEKENEHDNFMDDNDPTQFIIILKDKIDWLENQVQTLEAELFNQEQKTQEPAQHVAEPEPIENANKPKPVNPFLLSAAAIILMLIFSKL